MMKPRSALSGFHHPMRFCSPTYTRRYAKSGQATAVIIHECNEGRTVSIRPCHRKVIPPKEVNYFISHPSNNLGVWTCQWIIDTGLSDSRVPTAPCAPPSFHSAQTTPDQAAVLATYLTLRIPVLSTCSVFVVKAQFSFHYHYHYLLPGSGDYQDLQAELSFIPSIPSLPLLLSSRSQPLHRIPQRNRQKISLPLLTCNPYNNTSSPCL